jgi:tetratricopeptide (TPR) repeat protein
LGCYEKALELNPRLEQAWTNKGLLLSVLGHPEEAIAAYEKAVQLNPMDGKVWFTIGAMHVDNGRLREAVECFEKARRLGLTQAAEVVELCRQALKGK